jgi:DNA-binding NtrC family response regulator
MPAQRAPVRVLVVDDERIIADSLALILKGRGFDARAVYSGEDAAEAALKWAPDAVIADIIMGKMNGVALAMYLAQTLPSCKVLLMSGHLAAEDLINRSKNLGHDFPVLAKPFHPDSLLELLGTSSLAGNA